MTAATVLVTDTDITLDIGTATSVALRAGPVRIRVANGSSVAGAERELGIIEQDREAWLPTVHGPVTVRTLERGAASAVTWDTAVTSTAAPKLNEASEAY